MTQETISREVFATRRRFPMADEVRVTWPGPVFEERGDQLGPRDAVCILTHDPKFDVPVLREALRTDAAYIGVMGSRRTHEDRLERLAALRLARVLVASEDLSPAFYLAALGIAIALSMHAERAGPVYGMNLLGSGVGAVVAIPLRHLLDPDRYARFRVRFPDNPEANRRHFAFMLEGLAERHGSRYAPDRIIRDMAKQGKAFFL